MNVTRMPTKKARVGCWAGVSVVSRGGAWGKVKSAWTIAAERWPRVLLW